MDTLYRKGQQEEALQAFVAAVTARGLQAPALFLLETARPFHLLIQQALLVACPLLSPRRGERLLFWADLLEDPEALDRILDLLSPPRQGNGAGPRR